MAYLKKLPEHAHPDGGAPSGDEPTPVLPSVKRTPLDNGLTRWVLELDSLTDGFLTPAVDANSAITSRRHGTMVR